MWTHDLPWCHLRGCCAERWRCWWWCKKEEEAEGQRWKTMKPASGGVAGQEVPSHLPPLLQEGSEVEVLALRSIDRRPTLQK